MDTFYDKIISMNIYFLLKNKKRFLFLIFYLVFFHFTFFLSAEEFECKDYGKRNLTQKEYDAVIEVCDREIEKDEQKIKEIRGEAYGIQDTIVKLDNEIKISQSYINKKIAKANRLKKDTTLTEKDIVFLNTEQAKVNQSLKTLIFQRNQIEGNTIVEALLSKKTLSEFFEDIDTASFVEKRISTQIKKIKEEKEDLQRLGLELEERELLERELAEEKKIENNKIKKNKSYKNELLGILKKEEKGFVVSLESREEAKRAILARKFSVASGAKVSFGEAYEVIKTYQKELGMDPAFVLAILFQESGWKGKIGGNIGQCTYNQKNSHGNSVHGYEVMKKGWQADYLEIMNDLKINPEKQKISCPIPSDGSYGGAMGPAQFIPPTWKGVRKTAANIIGKDYRAMSPFINRDAFVSSGVLLKWNYYSQACSDYSKKYRHISSDRTLRERCAAAKYYAGGNWFKFRMTYGESVLQRANRFREDIRTLNS